MSNTPPLAPPQLALPSSEVISPLENSPAIESSQQIGGQMSQLANIMTSANINSGNKKQRKQSARQTKVQGGDQAIAQLKQTQQQDSSSKYQDVPGVSDWFQIKKIDLERQQSSAQPASKKPLYSNLPLNTHAWRPPRIDKERYQINVSERVEDAIEASTINPVLKKRPRRSRSTDALIIEEPAITKRRSLEDLEETKAVVRFESNQSKVIPAKDNPQMNLRYDIDRIDQERMTEYLELVDFIMRETLSSCNGMWLKGSSTQYQERALQLLHSYDYNYDLAKFHILFPSVMSMPERKEEILHSLDLKELQSIVADAVIDLRGCKTQEAEEAINNIRQAVKNRITVEDLNYYQQVLKKLRVETPDDVEADIVRSREFSKLIKKKCGSQVAGATQQIANDKKMKIEELLAMQRDAMESYYVVTPEMNTLTEQVSKAQAWQEKADQYMSQIVSLKSLQNLIQDARTIPVSFEQLYDQVKKRSQDGAALVEKIYNTFTKVTKTRTQVNSSNNQPQKIADTSNKELLYRQMLVEADELKITNIEVNKLRDHMDAVDQWKARVCLFLEDGRDYQISHKEVFNQLIKETALFKIELDLAEDLQRNLEFIEWQAKIVRVEKRGQRLKGSDSDSSELLPPTVKISLLQSLLQEGETKGFTLNEEQMPEIKRFIQLCTQAQELHEQITDCLRRIDDGKRPFYRHSDMLALKEKIIELSIDIEESQEFDDLLLKANEHITRCIEILQCSDVISTKQNIEDQDYLKEILQFREDLTDLCISNEHFSKFNSMMVPLQVWIENMRALIKTYHKSLELQQAFTHLNLLEQPKNGYSSNEDEQTKPIEFNDDFELLNHLIREAETSLIIFTSTKDYGILKDMLKRVEQWQGKVQQLLETEESLAYLQVVETLEKLVQEHLPLPNQQLQSLSKKLRRKKWLKRLQELKTSERVKLKSLESLTKESSHVDIQEDPECKHEADLLQAQLVQCRIWTDAQTAADMTSHKDILRLIELGKEILRFNLTDFVDMKTFHQDVIEWKDTTQLILNSNFKTARYNYEFLRKHLENAKAMEIEDVEVELLTHLVDLCAHWKSVARKILSSRELAKLENPNALSQDSSSEIDIEAGFTISLRYIGEQDLVVERVRTPYDVSSDQVKEKEHMFDNKRYCICRRGDDGLLFMIECDSCKEWFHGQCVGLQEDESHTQYTCIGCSKAHFRYDPLNAGAISNNAEEEQKVNSNQLKVFSKSLRLNHVFFREVIFEGLQIPIYLEELQELKTIHTKIDEWRMRVESILDVPIDSLIQQPLFDDEDDDIIINTKTKTKDEEELEQLQEKGGVESELMKLYLESESFPVDMKELSDALLTHIRYRRWFTQSRDLVDQLCSPASATLSNNAKLQFKKVVKKAIANLVDLQSLESLDNEGDILKIKDLEIKLRYGVEVLQANGPLPVSFVMQQALAIEPQLCQAWALIDKNDPTEPVNLNWLMQTMEALESSQELYTLLNEDTKVKVINMRNAIVGYQEWLQTILECREAILTQREQRMIDQDYLKVKTERIDLEQAFQDLVQEGATKHAWVDCPEKQALSEMMPRFMQWVDRSKYVLHCSFQAEESTVPELIIHIEKLLEEYQCRMPFYCELADALTLQLQGFIQVQQELIQKQQNDQEEEEKDHQMAEIERVNSNKEGSHQELEDKQQMEVVVQQEEEDYVEIEAINKTE